MKRIAFVSVLAILFVAPLTQRNTRAVNNGPSANGGFQFTLEDGNTRYIEFEARLQGDNATGHMAFSDPNATVGDENSRITGVQMRANFDCLRVEGNRAVIGGVISSSNVLTAIGRRMLLVLEDNGEGINQPAPDRLTWGIYETPESGWTPKDSERDDDIGASLSWLATDLERPENVGIPSKKDPLVGCQSFPLSSYSFVDVGHGNGNIQVRP
jgi:hypothetical protein